MNRELLEDLHQYFEQKNDRTGEEVNFLNRLTEELPYFQVTAVSREDLQREGFDISEVDDCDMNNIARKLSDDYCEQLFWLSLEIIADQGFDIPRYICPKCGNRANRYCSESKKFDCSSCDNVWKQEEPTGRFVLVEFPEDSKFYADCEVGYDSYRSEDNGAMFVPEHFYIAHTGTEPDAKKVHIPVTWPDSQEYFELQYENEAQYELCEPIEHGKAFDDFGSQAIWMPLCIIEEAK